MLQQSQQVLRQPQGSAVAAWDDAPSRSMIERLKLQFDPQLQLAPGRLPGVANPAARVRRSG